MRYWTDTLQNLLSIFLTSKCPLCQRQNSKEFCQDCQRQLQQCKFSNPSQFWQGELPVFVWGMYGRALKRAIAALKYENQPQVARPLGYWLGDAWINSPISTGKIKRHLPTVVPIPLHATKLKLRGYNQADLIAQSFCQYTGLPLQTHGLNRLRATDAQFGLSPQKREQNLAQAFCLGKGFNRNRPESVLLLDDIYTTGATVRSAAQILAQEGIRVDGIVAIATSKIIRNTESEIRN